MNIQHVPLEWTPRTWPMVKEHIASALEHTEDYTLDQVQTLVCTGQWMLLVAADGETIHGAATVHMFNRPSQRVAFITAIGGRLVSNRETFAQLKQLLAAFGATHIEGAARESIARLWSRYGFEEKYRIVGVKL
jgi:hypothetical protein